MQWIYDDGGRNGAGFKSKKRDCVVRSIAIATEIPYLKIYKKLQSRGLIEWTPGCGKCTSCSPDMKTPDRVTEGFLNTVFASLVRMMRENLDAPPHWTSIVSQWHDYSEETGDGNADYLILMLQPPTVDSVDHVGAYHLYISHYRFVCSWGPKTKMEIGGVCCQDRGIVDSISLSKPVEPAAKTLTKE